MKSPNSKHSAAIRDLWLNTNCDARYLAYKFGVSEHTVRKIVKGLKAPLKERKSLSKLHRIIGLMVIDNRLDSAYTKQAYANEHGMSHVRLADIEKGYHDLTITEIINLGLFDAFTAMDTALLGDD